MTSVLLIPPSPPGEPADMRSLCTSITPSTGSTSNLWMTADGPVCNRRLSATTRPRGPIYRRRLHLRLQSESQPKSYTEYLHRPDVGGLGNLRLLRWRLRVQFHGGGHSVQEYPCLHGGGAYSRVPRCVSRMLPWEPFQPFRCCAHRRVYPSTCLCLFRSDVCR